MYSRTFEGFDRWDPISMIGIVGSRRRNTANDRMVVENKFWELYQDGDWIVSGGCKEGGDRFAEHIAKRNGIPILIFYPNWKRYGIGAGFVRNSDIAFYSTKALIACVSADRTGGTEDTLKKYVKEYGNDNLFKV